MIAIFEKDGVLACSEISKLQQIEDILRSYYLNSGTLDLATMLLTYEKVIFLDRYLFKDSDFTYNISRMRASQMTEALVEIKDRYVVITKANSNVFGSTGFSINYLSLEHTKYNSLVTSYMRNTIIDKIMLDLC